MVGGDSPLFPELEDIKSSFLVREDSPLFPELEDIKSCSLVRGGSIGGRGVNLLFQEFDKINFCSMNSKGETAVPRIR
jgi:hypothetical protein